MKNQNQYYYLIKKTKPGNYNRYQVLFITYYIDYFKYFGTKIFKKLSKDSQVLKIQIFRNNDTMIIDIMKNKKIE